ncbi:MAG: NmrA family NAD(P)-binding protein [Haloarculaceae archaeon]
MSATVLVTGATGTVGRHVVAALADADATVRAATRDPDAAREELDAADEYVALDFDRRGTWVDALSGVDGVFLVRPPTVATATVGAFAETAGCADRIAYLSTLGAGKNPLIPHHRIEKRVAASDANHTLLRASFFAQNLHEVHRRDVVEDDEIRVPAGDGETSFVDARDVAAVAARALTEPGHRNRAYDLTGPGALTYDEVAAVLSDVLDREITYPSPSIPDYVRHMRDRGEPLPFVALTVGIYTTARLGLAGRVTDDAERVLGRPPRDLRTYVEDYADEFRR